MSRKFLEKKSYQFKVSAVLLPLSRVGRRDSRHFTLDNNIDHGDLNSW